MRLRTVIPVWAAAVVAAVVIGVVVDPSAYLDWLLIAMASLVVLTFGLQLALFEKNGLVDRMLASLGGGILILAAATVVLTLVASSAR